MGFGKRYGCGWCPGTGVAVCGPAGRRCAGIQTEVPPALKAKIVPIAVVKAGETTELLLSTWCTVGVTRSGGLGVGEMVDGNLQFSKDDVLVRQGTLGLGAREVLFSAECTSRFPILRQRPRRRISGLRPLESQRGQRFPGQGNCRQGRQGWRFRDASVRRHLQRPLRDRFSRPGDSAIASALFLLAGTARGAISNTDSVAKSPPAGSIDFCAACCGRIIWDGTFHPGIPVATYSPPLGFLDDTDSADREMARTRGAGRVGSACVRMRPIEPRSGWPGDIFFRGAHGAMSRELSRRLGPILCGCVWTSWLSAGGRGRG